MKNSMSRTTAVLYLILECITQYADGTHLSLNMLTKPTSTLQPKLLGITTSVAELQQVIDPLNSLNEAVNNFFAKVEEQNQEASDTLSRLFYSNSGWNFVNTKDGVNVEKRTLPAGSFVDVIDAAKGSKHACVKSSGVIQASAEAVFDLFQDNSRVSSYNEHCLLMKDVHNFPRKPTDQSWTKVSWAAGNYLSSIITNDLYLAFD